jgi:hypothetical protein
MLALTFVNLALLRTNSIITSYEPALTKCQADQLFGVIPDREDLVSFRHDEMPGDRDASR